MGAGAEAGEPGGVPSTLLTRRATLRLGLGAALALAASGCSDADDGTGVGGAPGPPPAGSAGAVPQPADVIRTSWATDPWSLGSYTYLPVGSTPTVREQLAQPLDDRVFLAGEATSTAAPATVHGARASGTSAADRVRRLATGSERIVVVGAGAAGARAARVLADAGHEIIVVEARPRIGGRLDTTRPAGWPIPVEQGASWVHDTGASDLAEVLEALDVRTSPFGYDAALLAPDDRLGGADRAYELGDDAIRQALAWAEEQEVDTSLADALERSGAAAVAERARAGVLDHHLRSQIVTEYGADPTELSAWWALDEGTEGDDLLVTGGYAAIVERDLDGIDVRLSWPVTRIERSPEGVRLIGPGDEALDASRVVVTLPVGVLQAGSVAFDPPLPRSHLDAIAALRMGVLDKVWLRWDEPWWGEPAEVWTREPGGDDPFTEWVNLLPATGEPVLVALVGGAGARAWSRRSDDEVRAEALRSLQPFLDAGW